MEILQRCMVPAHATSLSPTKRHGPRHDWPFLSTPEDSSRRPPQGQMLCTLWPTQHIPEYWKQRWLIPLPKTAELNNIEDLRPICLLEIFRKLWTSILTHRIRGAWETHDMLDPSQHGFRAKHSTDSASLLLVGALKHAKETHSACLVSSWDIRRAFDSISKPA